MHESFRHFLCLLGLALTAAWLSAPTTAWSMHKTAHIASPVADDEHHHHGDSGGIEAPGQSTDDEDGGLGHDHLPSLTSGLAATVDGPPALGAPFLAGVLTEPSPTIGLTGLTQPPPARPPRSI